MQQLISGRKHPLALCEMCPLAGWQHKYVPTEIPKLADGEQLQAIVVGEAPGLEEIVARRPFIGPSGQLMRNTLAEVGYDPTKVAYTNAVLCRPPKNELKNYQGAVEACAPRLVHELGTLGDPTVPILAVGAVGVAATLKAIIGPQAPAKIAITKSRGTIYETSNNRAVHSAVHPAYVLRVPAALELFKADVAQMRYGKKLHWLQQPPSHVVVANIKELLDQLALVQTELARVAREGGTPWVAWDVETENLRWYKTTGWGGPHAILALGINYGVGNACPSIIVPEKLLKFDVVRAILDEAFSGWTRTCAHNGKFDLHMLRRDGVPHASVFADTLLMHYAYKEEPPHGLKELAASEYGVHDYEAELVQRYLGKLPKAERNYRAIPLQDLYQYLAWDVAITRQLAVDYEAKLKGERSSETGDSLWYRPFAFPLMSSYEALWETEELGVEVDRNYLERAQAGIEADIDESAKVLGKLVGHANFNPNSWKQVGKVLWDEMGFKLVPSKFYADRSTGIAALQAANLIYVNTQQKYDSDIAFLRGLLHYRRLRKIQGTYVKPILASLDRANRAHPVYYLNASITGRLSAKEPPIQTVPRSSADWYGGLLRSAFVAGVAGDEAWNALKQLGAPVAEPYRKGEQPAPELYKNGVSRGIGVGTTVLDAVLVDGTWVVPELVPDAYLDMPVFVMADYSQAELRVWAHVTQDPYLLTVYREGRDLHNENSIRLYGPNYTKEQRTWLKNWVFAFVYGGNEYSFASQSRLPLAQASALARGFALLVPVAVAWRDLEWAQFLRQGYIETVFGRRRRIDRRLITKETIEGFKHEIWNFRCQSTASDLTLESHARLSRAGWPVVITMHDMLTVQTTLRHVRAARNALEHTMVSVGQEFVPSVPWKVDVDVVRTWVARPDDDDKPVIGDVLALEELEFEDATLEDSEGVLQER